MANDKFRTLYHVTPESNLTSIIHHGILPTRDTRKKHRVWLAAFHAVPWVKKHLAEQRAWKGVIVVIFRVRVARKTLCLRRRGIYYTKRVVHPAQILGYFHARLP